MSESLFNIGKYLKRVASNYNKDKSMTEILNNFSVISKDYQDFKKNESTNYYSHNNYAECSETEQKQFDNELSTIECLVCNSIYEKAGKLTNWKIIYNLLLDPIYKTTEKLNRKVVYSSDSGARPIGESAFNSWNGLQIIDLDIKNKIIADKLKPLIFNDLSKYHWFLGCCKSASGKSLHIWTKVTPISVTLENRRIEYLCNFRHKYSYVYIAVLSHAEELGLTSDSIIQFMDMAMAKPQQGIFISSDDSCMMNTNFIDYRLDVDFELAYDTGVSAINWISHPDLKEIFAKLEWFNNDKFVENVNINVSDVTNISERDITKSVKKHYKHAQRWQLANTLTSIYGYDKALKLMCEICSGTDYKELKGDVKTASIHSKPISIWAVTELNKYHGFKIKYNNADEIYNEKQEELKENQKQEDLNLDSPTAILNRNSKTVYLSIDKNQYLSDIKNEIIDNLSNITLLEAGAGYGKTEMIKALKSKTLLILPFTSTIKAKVESSETTADWLYYYGNKRPTLDELLGEKSMSMTIDKFSRLNVMELDAANFKYIVLDESHLLFTSSYRDVMAPSIQRLANCKSKVIMMTGTPTAELLFFPNIQHIKVTKEDVRIKEFEAHMCPSGTEQLIEMCKSIANEIMEGHKILFPTNKGNLYMEQITGIVQKLLDQKSFGRQINVFYYKKSNFGEESMDDININKSIGNNDIVYCTTYLSVGVDICDKHTFSIIFSEQMIPQDLEQFANRLRNNDLYVKMFLPKVDTMGNPINYYYTQPLNLGFNKDELLMARDFIKTCNDMLERNGEEAKYNPLIQSLLSANKYLKYDENDSKYYIDETTYKLKVFENKYSEYAKQLEIMLNGIRYYGYKVNIIDHSDEISEDRKEAIDEYLRSCKNMRFNYQTAQTFAFLEHINDSNMDIYKEILRGNYEIFKGDKYKEDRQINNLYVEDIETVEKNTPIIVSLYKYYDCNTIKDIYNYCLDIKQNRINYAKLGRIRRFVNIEYNRKKNKLDFPVVKFVKEAQTWADRNFQTTKTDIEQFQKEWAAKFANSIPDTVVDDVMYLEKIYELIKELWKVVIIQDKSKNKIIHIRPFELLWDKKESLDNVYGNNPTKSFFLEQLIDDIKPIEEIEPEVEEVLPDLPMTRKYKLEQIESELNSIVHSDFNYYEYSKLDNSNDKFIAKQTNTSHAQESVLGQLGIITNQGSSYIESKNSEQQSLDFDD